MSWWIGQTEETLTEEVAAAPDEVRSFYTDLDNIKLVHPLVVSVRTITRSESPAGYQQVYRVRDRIPLGPLVLRTSYVATLDVAVAGDVVAQARQFPLVRLHTHVTFEPIQSGTRVIERMRIQAPLPLVAFTTREAVQAHTAMLSGIRNHFG
jgi:hypothetical protein